MSTALIDGPHNGKEIEKGRDGERSAAHPNYGTNYEVQVAAHCHWVCDREPV